MTEFNEPSFNNRDLIYSHMFQDCDKTLTDLGMSIAYEIWITESENSPLKNLPWKQAKICWREEVM